MRHKTKALLWVLLVFVIGTLFGAAIVRLSLRSRLVADDEVPAPSRMEVPQPPPGTRPPNRPGQQQRPFRPGAAGAVIPPGVLQSLLQRLEMNSEQERKAREILERSRTDYAAVELRRNQAQRRIRQKALRDLRDILNPRQRLQLRTFLSQLQERRRQP